MSDDSTVKRNLMLFILALVALGVGIYIVAQMVTEDTSQAERNRLAEGAILERIKPVGVMTVGKVPAAGAATTAAAAGPEVPAACMGCHGTGVLGAPKVDSKDDWSPRVAQGMAALVASAKNGKGSMPPQGAGMSDEQLKAAISAMLEKAGLSAE